MPTISDCVFNCDAPTVEAQWHAAGCVPPHLHIQDARIDWLLQNHNLSGKSVLECGPLHGNHSLQLAATGADVTAVEANRAHFLSCLVAANIQQSRVRFLYGDFVQYVKMAPGSWDMIVAIGVLYHQSNPIDVLRAFGAKCEYLALWSHVYEPAEMTPEHCAHFSRVVIVDDSVEYEAWRRDVPPGDDVTYLGGFDKRPVWLGRSVLRRALANCSFAIVAEMTCEVKNPNGPEVMYLCAKNCRSMS